MAHLSDHNIDLDGLLPMNDRSLSELPGEKKSNFGTNSHRRAVSIGPFELARSR